MSNFFKTSIGDIRGNYGLDSFIEIFALYFLLYSEKWLGERLIKNKSLYYAAIAVLLVSIIVYFSRTMLIVFAIGFLSMSGYSKITRVSLGYLALMFLAVGLFYGYLFSIKLERNSTGIEGFFYKLKIAPSEIFTAKIDRNDHQQLWDHWRAYEAKRAFALMNQNPLSYVFGNGYGSVVNLKFKAPIGDEPMKFISRLHNGYVFVFYKMGPIGLFLILFFLVNLYSKTYHQSNNSQQLLYHNRFISFIGLFFLFTSIIISGIYISKEVIIFILGALLCAVKKEFILKKTDNSFD